MYELPPEDQRPGCRQTWLVTRAVFAILLPPLLAIFGMLGALALAVVLFSVHPALALLPVGAVVAAVLLFARWEEARHPPEE